MKASTRHCHLKLRWKTLERKWKVRTNEDVTGDWIVYLIPIAALINYTNLIISNNMNVLSYYSEIQKSALGSPGLKSCSSQAWIPSGGSREDLFPFLPWFQGAHLFWLVVPFHLQNQNGPSSLSGDISLQLALLFPSSALKDPCENTGPSVQIRVISWLATLMPFGTLISSCHVT